MFIAKTLDNSIAGNDDITKRYYDPILNHFGMGIYISPLPNRAVFTRGQIWHSINRVDPNAGDHARCSIVAFFMKEKHK